MSVESDLRAHDDMEDEFDRLLIVIRDAAAECREQPHCERWSFVWDAVEASGIRPFQGEGELIEDAIR